MKKTYIQPSCEAYNVDNTKILAGSGGVINGSPLGNEYNSSDVSYSKGEGYFYDDEKE